MTLIVILNAALGLAILGVMVALHAKAIVADHRQHNGSARLWAWRPVSPRPAGRVPSPAGARDRALQRRRPALLTD